jgi:hypothetical protein
MEINKIYFIALCYVYFRYGCLLYSTYSNLLYFVVICRICIFPNFGILHQEKSGNPAQNRFKKPKWFADV